MPIFWEVWWSGYDWGYRQEAHFPVMKGRFLSPLKAKAYRMMYIAKDPAGFRNRLAISTSAAGPW